MMNLNFGFENLDLGFEETEFEIQLIAAHQRYRYFPDYAESIGESRPSE